MGIKSKQAKFVKAKIAGLSTEEAEKVAGIDPAISSARAEAGRRGAASRNRILITEQNRRKVGKEKYEQRLAAIRAEENIPPDGWDKDITKFNWHEVMRWAEQVLLGIGYNRKYPPLSRDEVFNIYEIQQKQSQELRVYFDGYPEYMCLDMIDWMKTHHLTDGLRKLAIWTFEEFINWESKEANKQFVHESDLRKIKKALLDLQQGKDLYDPPEEPKQSSPTPEEQIAAAQQERATWEWRGRNAPQISIFVPTPESVEQLRLEQELQVQIRQKAEEARRLQDEHLRALPPGALEYLHGN